jgi:hypothetical protein
MVHDLLQDLRVGFWMLRKNPGITVIVVLTLALGVGANTAIFGLVNGFLLRPMPVPSSEQVTALVIQESGSPLGALAFSYPQFVEFPCSVDGPSRTRTLKQHNASRLSTKRWPNSFGQTRLPSASGLA